ncbi:MAG: elongation factor G [Atopobiaceae bacterium]|nr:elongation factor G [Atopobiaceae bacterium]
MAEKAVKNVALVGQAGVGKTMLAEAMLHLTGKTTRLGGHAGTKPTLDYDSQESARGFSISLTMAPVIWQNTRINVLDAPCYPDFVGDAYTAMSAAETALFVVDAADGPQVTTTRLWYAAEDLKIARAIVVNRLDRPETSFESCMDLLHDRFGNRLGAVTIPMGTGDAFSGVIDVLHMKARHLEGVKVVETEVPAEYLDAAQDAHDTLVDLVAEADDEIMMKYLEGEEITLAELEGLLGTAIKEGVFVPVFAAAAVKEEGIISLLNAMVAWFPTMADYGPIPLVNGEQLDIDPDDNRPVAFDFKSLNDPQNGKYSFLKVLTGTVTPGLELINARTGRTERLGHLYLMCGRETTEVKSVAAGDICVVAKMDARTGDTLSATGKVQVANFKFPNSLHRVAIEPDVRGTEGKVYDFLQKAADADPTLIVGRDEETAQTVISAIGEAQISVLLERMAENAKVKAHIVKLRIPYRETIRRTATGHGRHKKQTGGSGQFGDCHLRIEPNPDQGYEFVDEVVGGAIPRGFIPAIDKGVQETMAGGVIAGYPMIDVKCAVFDGQYHPVDSNEMAFKTAARLGFQDAVAKADPVLLEPMAHLKITVPESYAGAVMGDISGSRGRVEGMNAAGAGETTVEATVPYAEVTDYATRLRSLTRGTGVFELEINGYEQVPHDIQQKLAAEYQEKRASGER